MKVLLDTCVISEVRKAKGNPRVRERVEAIRSNNLFLSVVTLGELAKGISLLAEGKQRSALMRWLLALEQDYGTRVLPIDAGVSRIWGELTASAQQSGRVVPAADGLIAATAICHGIHVMTRNVGDFQPTGAMLVNPWEDA